MVRKVLFCILAFILTWDNDAASNSPTHFSSRRWVQVRKRQTRINCFTKKYDYEDKNSNDTNSINWFI